MSRFLRSVLLVLIVFVPTAVYGNTITDSLVFRYTSDTARFDVSRSIWTATVDFEMQWVGPPGSLWAIEFVVEFPEEKLELIQFDADPASWSGRFSVLPGTPGKRTTRVCCLLDSLTSATNTPVESFRRYASFTFEIRASSPGGPVNIGFSPNNSVNLNEVKINEVFFSPSQENMIGGNIYVPVSANLSCCDTPGDVNDDGSVNISDAVEVIDVIFGGATAPLCADDLDLNDDGQSNISDAIGLIDFIFKNGAAPRCPRIR